MFFNLILEQKENKARGQTGCGPQSSAPAEAGTPCFVKDAFECAGFPLSRE